MIERKIGLSIMMGVWTFVPYGYAMDENKNNKEVNKNQEQQERLTSAKRKQINKELLAAVKRNDIAGVKKTLEEGADVNTYEKNFILDYTPLSLACKKNNCAMVNVLLEARADVNYKHENSKKTALMTVCYFSTILDAMSESIENNISTMRSLIAAKADVNASNDVSGTTVLMHVINDDNFNKNDIERFNIIERVCLLINAEADVNKVDNRGMTVLKRLVEHNWNNHSLIKMAIYAGADIRAIHHGIDRQIETRSALEMANLNNKPLQEFMIEAEKTRMQARMHTLSKVAIILRHIPYVPLALLVFDYTMIPYDTFDVQRVLSAFIKAEQKNKEMEYFEKFYDVIKVRNKRCKCVVS